MNPFGQRIVESVAPSTAYWYIRFLAKTMRLEYRNREALARARELGGTYLFAFWHSRLLLMVFAYPGDRGLALQSRHRDSQLLARMMRRFGIGAVWGSTSRGGMTAAREVVRRLKEGHDVAVAPDGPRGPRRRAQPGIVAIARLSGKPIVPLAFSARPSARLTSWDRSLVPLPFGRGRFVYGEPIVVDRRADRDEQERQRVALEEELNRLTDLVDTEVGIPLIRPAPLESEEGR
jgi:lysophospholipid acyltransferase (LPLAT)-like uncharacterized protein